MAQKSETNLLHFSEDDSDDSTADDPSFLLNVEAHQKYKMDYGSRGLAIIIAHSTFEVAGWEGELGDRGCCQQDIDLSKRCFEGLGFDVEILKDKKFHEIKQILNDMSKEDHSNRGCLAIIVSTHGTFDNFLFAYDSVYDLNELFKPFCAANCVTLAGKPKLYFIQACRGENAQSGIDLSVNEAQLSSEDEKLAQNSGKMFFQATNEESSVDVAIFNEAYEDDDGGNHLDIKDDFLVAFSTIPDYVSFQRPGGSWFIKSLCKRLNKRTDRHLLHILTFVNWEIAIRHESNTPKRLNYHRKKQMSTVTSRLQKFLFFC
ncbi:caspase-1-like isoform X2 [Frankliniella occidentalis]|uniref:Caspase-1-like isoform X2 n=1 Tax=Frankliniella occidentalis TaxID=133901 RepID=A0A6J1SRR7_FRAOC|nr:caspase-1-like isoform X2 [Frankliniella occidentalis]